MTYTLILDYVKTQERSALYFGDGSLKLCFYLFHVLFYLFQFYFVTQTEKLPASAQAYARTNMLAEMSGTSGLIWIIWIGLDGWIYDFTDEFEILCFF